MEIINTELSRIKPYEYNPRNNDEAVEYVANSIKEFGFKNPIILDSDGVIIAGHTRYRAAQKLGLEKVPCVYADDLTEEQAAAFRLADNKTAEFAKWDFELLQQELDELSIDMDQFGFGDMELTIEEPAVKEDDYEIEEKEEPKAKLGDVYQLGQHRLMCGDSTILQSVEKLMDGKKADLFLTDPPYNVNYTGNGSREGILNDNFETDEQAGKELWFPAFKNAINVSNEKCSVFCFMPQGGTHMMMMMMMMQQAGWKVMHEIIWKKQSIVLGRQDFNYQHEPILYGWNKTHKFVGGGKYSTTSIWEFDRPTKSKEHPTMKPVELMAEPILNTTDKGDIVLDLFGGSGSTLIACEQLGRKCFMMEYDPHYVDVIIDRWEQLTGQKAALIRM